MSTVLWSNILINNKVLCDETDKYALYKHSKQLDKLCKQLSLPGFIDAQDFTDMQFCLEDKELPNGMESTNELMAAEGNWISLEDGEKMISQLLHHIKTEKTKFGLLSNQHNDVVSELEETLVFIQNNNQENAKFNFAVVM